MIELTIAPSKLGRSPIGRERLLVLSGNVQEGSRWVYNVKDARSQDMGWQEALYKDPLGGNCARKGGSELEGQTAG